MTRISLFVIGLALPSLTAFSQLANAQRSPLPAGPNFQRFLQSPPPVLDLTNPLRVQTERTFVYPPAKAPNISLLPSPAGSNPCSGPLLEVGPPRGHRIALHEIWCSAPLLEIKPPPGERFK